MSSTWRSDWMVVVVEIVRTISRCSTGAVRTRAASRCFTAGAAPARARASAGATGDEARHGEDGGQDRGGSSGHRGGLGLGS